VLRAASSGDGEARSTFARSYAGPIRAYLAHRWRDEVLAAEVDDAVQETFVECIKPGGVLERADPERGDFRALLYGVVRNVARRFEERAAKTGRRSGEESVYLDELPDRAIALSRVFDRAWARSLLREAVVRHEAQARSSGDDGAHDRFRVLRMRHDEGLPIREIAAALGESDTARVHNDYRRARREFAVHLREVVAAHTGAQAADVDAECRRLTGLLGA
jgi:RNA polymerase sigma-70 factor (ECF subfamily)